MPQRKKLLFSGLLGLGVLGVAAIFSLSASKALGRADLVDGVELSCIGLTKGTNHWNPAVSDLERFWHLAHQNEKVSWAARRLLPRPNPAAPMIIMTEAPAPVLWFSRNTNAGTEQRICFRLLDEKEQEFGGVYHLRFRPNNVATGVTLRTWKEGETRKIRGIRFYQTSAPLAGPLPELLMDFLLGEPLGTMRLDLKE